MSKQHFEPDRIRHITIDFAGNIYEVVHMCDRYARDTIDPALAVTCVLHVGDRYITDTTDTIPIYTVH